jgi:hypothetical protein
MNISKQIALTWFVLGSCAAIAPVTAQERSWTLGVTGGTLGVGPELAYRLGPRVGMRANAGFLSVSRNEEVDDIDYDGDLKLNSFGAMVDWYPTGGGLRLSAGARINNNEIEIVGSPTTSVTVGGNTYTPQQVGTLSGTLAGDDFVPVLTLGYGGTLAQGFTLGAELGVMWQGKMKIDNLRTTGLLASAAQFQADVEREEQSIEDELDGYELWPILQIEFLYRF